jgi:Leucine-rich repeat (LRR) protein
LKIENLVSLPNLHFLDLSQNKLTELGACISKLAAMRVLILSKNLLSALNGPNGIAATVSNLMNLDMLDLHDNRIQGALDLKLLNF